VKASSWAEWPHLNSKKRLWVPHPCGFQGAVFDFAKSTKGRAFPL
jgi:hypothetical protein